MRKTVQVDKESLKKILFILSLGFVVFSSKMYFEHKVSSSPAPFSEQEEILYR